MWIQIHTRAHAHTHTLMNHCHMHKWSHANAMNKINNKNMCVCVDVLASSSFSDSVLSFCWIFFYGALMLCCWFHLVRLVLCTTCWQSNRHINTLHAHLSPFLYWCFEYDWFVTRTYSTFYLCVQERSVSWHEISSSVNKKKHTLNYIWYFLRVN